MQFKHTTAIFKTTERTKGNVNLWLCCERCGKIISGYVECVWTLDKNGEPENVTFLHSNCEVPFVVNNRHKGEWMRESMHFGARMKILTLPAKQNSPDP